MSFSAGKNLQNNVNVTEAQTLSNKTLDNTNAIDGASIDNSTITGASIESPSRLDMKKDTLANLQTYAASATNGQLVYATDAKKTFQVVDAALVEVGGGSAAINYIENSDAEQNVDGWNRYVDAVQSIPEDGTGGLISDINFTQNTTSPLRGTADFNLNKRATDAQGQGVAYDFTIDKADQAKKLTISFDYDASDANYADDDIGVFIYDVTNSNLIRVNGENLKGGKGKHYAQFQTAADSTSYRLILHIASTNATEYDVYFDNFSVGPRELAKGTIVTDWENYTPTFTGLGTVTDIDIKYRRVGSNLEILGDFTTGTTSAVETEMTLPFSLSVGTENSSTLKVGTFRRDSSVTSSNSFTILATDGDSFLNFSVNNQSSNFNPLEPKLSTQMMASSERISIEASVPIQGWSSNAVTSEDLGGREVVVRGAGNSGAAITANTENVDFDLVGDTTASWSQTGPNGTDTFTAPETGYYSISGAIAATATILSWQVITYIKPVGGSFTTSKNIGTLDGFSRISFAGVEYLKKGEQLAIRTTDTFTQVDSIASHHIHIQKLASPQSILETETVAARYTSNSGQNISNLGTILVYEDLIKDTHNAYNTSTGVYTVPVSGWYDIKAKYKSSTTDQNVLSIRVLVNSASIDDEVNSSPRTMNLSVSINTHVYLEKGDEIEIQGVHSNIQNMTTNSAENVFSITRIK